jgi:apolipoprotein N-acyltransferase
MGDIDIKSSDASKAYWLRRAVGLVSGIMMATANLYPELAPVQLVALIPLFYLAAKYGSNRRAMVAAGFYAGLGYTIPQMLVLRLPLPLAAVFIFRMTVTFVVLAWGGGILMRGSAVAGPVAVGALLTVLDWVNISVLSIWGMAQSLVRPWSNYPSAIQFVSVTGITGIVFIIAALQALLANSLARAELRRRCITGVIVLSAIVIALNLMVSYPSESGRLTVAAIGWTDSQEDECGGVFSQRGFEALFAGPATKAASGGAKLVAAPETAFAYSFGSFDGWVDKFQKVARQNDIYLAIGYLNIPAKENRMLFAAPDGRILAQYTKTHLTPFEDFNRGEDQPSVVDIKDFKAGGMICHDDNFTRLSRRYGRAQTQIVVVPTRDWATVKGAHLQSSIHRAIECRYAILRPAKNGISAIIAPTGEVLAQMDHYKEGPGFVAAEVPLCSETTLFSRFGHWPAPAAAIYLVVYVVLLRSRLAAGLDRRIKSELGL